MKTLITVVMLVPGMLYGQQRENIESTLEVVDIQSDSREVIYKEDHHFEAPNWSVDGKFFVINQSGKLFSLSRKNPVKKEINTGFAGRCNNDHGISPDGKNLVISHNLPDTGSTIYILPIGGGNPKRITEKAPSYWHGWSPDGKTLVYVGRRDGEYDIYSIPVTGGKEIRLTKCPGLDDGPEYSPDGKSIYYNSYCSGRMEIWRMQSDGTNPVQITDDAYSNWFPHPSPDGKYIVFLSYLTDQQQGHPFGKDVKLRLMEIQTGNIKDLTEPFFGGQGTINVPSWSPDSREVAFVSYRLKE